MHKKLTVADPSFNEFEKDEILLRMATALDSKLSMGSNVMEFEQLFKDQTKASFAVSMNSCTSCLEAALNFFNVKGCDVLVPCATFVATASAVVLEGGNPIICDIDKNSLGLTLEIVKANVTSRTKGIIYVHFSGYISEELTKISDYCREQGLFLIEDCAHATGGALGDKSVGLIGDIGCFSFFSTKIVTAAEAGIAVTNDLNIYKHLRSLQNRGRDISAPIESYDKIWRNVRLSEFNAIIGVVGLKNINFKIQQRRFNSKIYDEAFREINEVYIPSAHAHPNSVFWKYLVVLENKGIRDDFLGYLHQNNIMCDTMYTPMLHQHEAFCAQWSDSIFPVANDIFSRHVCLPCHEKLGKLDLEYICQHVCGYFI